MELLENSGKYRFTNEISLLVAEFRDILCANIIYFSQLIVYNFIYIYIYIHIKHEDKIPSTDALVPDLMPQCLINGQ